MNDVNFTPHMSEAEIGLLEKVLPDAAKVLEFGSGGSSQFFLEHQVRSLMSIESDKLWLEKLLTNPAVFTYHQNGVWTPLHINIGPVGEWGVPLYKHPKVNWLDYHQHCWRVSKDNSFDLVLIDGRFRVACTCQTLLRCKNENVLLVIHDFWNRPVYHIVLDFLEVADKADTLAVCKLKKNLDWRKLALVLQHYQLIWD